MLLRDLTKVYISEYDSIVKYGKKMNYIKTIIFYNIIVLNYKKCKMNSKNYRLHL